MFLACDGVLLPNTCSAMRASPLRSRIATRMALIKAKVGLLSHRSAHVGTKPPWWKDAGIDPAKAARKLWNDSRMDQGRIAPGPTSHCPTADRRLPTVRLRPARRQPNDGRDAQSERPSSINTARGTALASAIGSENLSARSRFRRRHAEQFWLSALQEALECHDPERTAERVQRGLPRHHT